MSEFTENSKRRTETLKEYIQGLINNQDGIKLLEKYKLQEITFEPLEVIYALDNVMITNNDIEKIKSASNKLFNILYKNLSSLNQPDYQNISFLNILTKDNAGVKNELAKTRKLIKQINKSVNNEIKTELSNCFNEILNFTEHYKVMQNIVFPEIENTIEKHACLKIMWSFHDDILKNIKKTIEILNNPDFDIKQFNIVSSKVYFNINTISFREEYVLFPIMNAYFEAEIFENMQSQLSEFKLQYAKFQQNRKTPNNNSESYNGIIQLSTGKLNLEQLELIFSHLPVDMTYVDENDEVKYYSDPRHRIFPRTRSIIGRKVQNCHPHESVHIVNQIVEAFKKGEKDEASFWIKIGEKFILIKYFAIRNEKNNYKGALEVSQEISDIQKLTGERRLLDW